MDNQCDRCHGRTWYICQSNPCPDCGGTGIQQKDPEYLRGYHDGYMEAIEAVREITEGAKE